MSGLTPQESILMFAGVLALTNVAPLILMLIFCKFEDDKE